MRQSVLDAFAREITFSLPAVGQSLYSPAEEITVASKCGAGCANVHKIVIEVIDAVRCFSASRN